MEDRSKRRYRKSLRALKQSSTTTLDPDLLEDASFISGKPYDGFNSYLEEEGGGNVGSNIGGESSGDVVRGEFGSGDDRAFVDADQADDSDEENLKEQRRPLSS